MKKYAYAGSCFAAGAVLLVATLCAAQTTTKSGKAASGQTSTANHQSTQKSIAVDHAGGNGVRRADGGTHTGPASTGTNPLYEPNDKAASNPMHESNGASGVNPLYEPKDKAASGTNSGGSHSSNQHPRQTMRRYRPGNNKTTSANPTPRDKSGHPQR